MNILRSSNPKPGMVPAGARALTLAAMLSGFGSTALASSSDPKCNLTKPVAGVISSGTISSTGVVTVSTTSGTVTRPTLLAYLADRGLHVTLDAACIKPTFIAAHRMPHSQGVSSQTTTLYTPYGPSVRYLTTGYEASGALKGNGIVSWRSRLNSSGQNIWRAELLAEVDDQVPAAFSDNTSIFNTAPSALPAQTISFPIYEIDPRYIEPVTAGGTGTYVSSHDNYWNRQLAGYATSAPLIVSKQPGTTTPSLSITDYQNTARQAFMNPDGTLIATSSYASGQTTGRVGLKDIWQLMSLQIDKEISFQLHMHGAITIPPGATYRGTVSSTGFTDYTADGYYLTEQMSDIAAQAMFKSIGAVSGGPSDYMNHMWFDVHLPVLCSDMYYYRNSLTTNTTIRNQIASVVTGTINNGSIGCLAYMLKYKDLIDAKTLTKLNTLRASASLPAIGIKSLRPYYLVINMLADAEYNNAFPVSGVVDTNGSIPTVDCALTTVATATKTLVDIAKDGVTCLASTATGLQILGFDSTYLGGKENLRSITSYEDFDPRLYGQQGQFNKLSQANFVVTMKKLGYISLATDSYPDFDNRALVVPSASTLGLPRTGYCFLNITGTPQTLSSARCPTRAVQDRGSDVPYVLGASYHAKVYTDIQAGSTDTTTLVRPDIYITDHPIRAWTCLQVIGTTSQTSTNCPTQWNGF
jgi:hypothetical protein